MSSYMLKDIDGMWLVLMRIPFMTWKDIFKCFLYSYHMRLLLIVIFGIKEMVWL
jgi:hypothetical protein